MKKKFEMSDGQDPLRKMDRDRLVEKIRALEERLNRTKSEEAKLKELKDKLKQNNKRTVETRQIS